ncbi:TrmO family methyltransferase domain-containing protein [Nonomuraea polychroma]|uniref:TrmO family methyltransferase domain-containing protein n=1 Tax=Nonomuraea polychroma TaxID=46176 RepID=UPI003D8BD29B
MTYEIRPIGVVESPLADRASAPKQGVEGSPDAWLVFDPAMADGIRDLTVGDEVFVLTWLHLADRSVLAVHPRDDLRNPLTGVFSTRSSDRPNPIGLGGLLAHEISVANRRSARPLNSAERAHADGVHGSEGRVSDALPRYRAGGWPARSDGVAIVTAATVGRVR